jgi:sensor histidine kinase YesM
MKAYLSLTLFICLAMSTLAQEFAPLPKNNFIGFQPMITVEPYDQHYNTVEINVLPFVYERIIAQHWGVKTYSIFNYQINPETDNTISHTGLGLSVPYYFKEREEILPYSGLFVGPHAGYSYNFTDMNNNLTFAGEIGWNFPIREKFAFIIDIQYGRTLIFTPTKGINVPHVGIYAKIGIWL